MSAPDTVKGFPDNFQNRNVTIEGNHIDDSYAFGIFVANADGLKIIGNAIGQTFLRGAFDAGQLYGIKPDSGTYVGRSRNVTIDNNTVAHGRVARVAVAVDGTCDRKSVHVGNNRLT
jgi:parallel beta-helix repeat protein